MTEHRPAGQLVEHLRPRRAHSRALAGGKNDCQTCAASTIPALRRGSIHDNSFSAASGRRGGRRPHVLYLKNAKFDWQIAARKSELETVRTCPEISLTVGSSSPARTPLRFVTQLGARRRRNRSLRQKRNLRPELNAVDRGRPFRFRDCLARSLLAQSAQAASDPRAHPMAV
jgi:hypothetical protein